MCRLAGITHFDIDVHRDIAEHFFALAEKGMVIKGDSPGHLDGWGVGYYREGKAGIHRSGSPLPEERDTFFSLLEEIGQSPVLILHLRKSAWPMTTAAEHAHPFQYNNVLFAHNGTVRDFLPLLRAIKDREEMNADPRDSEVIFRYMLDIARMGKSLGEAFEEALATIHAEHVYTALNILFTDGRSLSAYRDFTTAPDYYSLFSASRGKSALVASEPLSSAERWSPLPEKTLLAFP